MSDLVAFRESIGNLREEFFQFRGETRAALTAIHAQVQDVRTELQAVRDEMRTEVRGIRDEIRAGDEESRRFMRVLFEELVDRIKRLGETGPPRSVS